MICLLNTDALNLFHRLPKIWIIHFSISFENATLAEKLPSELEFKDLNLQVTIITHVVKLSLSKLSYWLIDDLVNDQIVLEKTDTDQANDKLALWEAGHNKW